jgi:hypothetical protein
LLGATGAQGRALIDIDPTTGTGTMRASHGAFGPVTELEFRDDGMLFGATGGGSSNIITIDPVTGEETLVGMHTFGAVNGLEFVGAMLYGTFIPSPGGGGPSELVTVDQTTGALTVIGPTGFGNIGGLAFDASSRTMYGVARSDLITIDLDTGAGTLVGPTGFFSVSALEFGPDGILYGGIGGFSTDAGSLISIDPATGAGTLIGPTGFSSLDGLAFVPSPPQQEGRMTGDGSVFATDATRVTHDFELHCDISLPHNLEINWSKGNRFHLTQLDSATCSDDPSISEGQPVAGFDTFVGSGIGRLNGVDGATIDFKLTDAGEPGKRTDLAEFSINGGAALSVSNPLHSGNHQADKE